jgi:Leucine-rich repeat (LRR) protein
MDDEELKSAVNWDDTDKKTLDLSNWKIERLPKEIGNFRELRQLRLRGNLLSELPEEMDQLENLEELSLIDIEVTQMG